MISRRINRAHASRSFRRISSSFRTIYAMDIVEIEIIRYFVSKKNKLYSNNRHV